MSNSTSLKKVGQKAGKKAMTIVRKELENFPRLRIHAMSTTGEYGDILVVKLALAETQKAFKDGETKKLPFVTKEYPTGGVATGRTPLRFDTAQEILEHSHSLLFPKPEPVAEEPVQATPAKKPRAPRKPKTAPSEEAPKPRRRAKKEQPREPSEV